MFDKELNDRMRIKFRHPSTDSEADEDKLIMAQWMGRQISTRDAAWLMSKNNGCHISEDKFIYFAQHSGYGRTDGSEL